MPSFVSSIPFLKDYFDGMRAMHFNTFNRIRDNQIKSEIENQIEIIQSHVDSMKEIQSTNRKVQNLKIERNENIIDNPSSSSPPSTINDIFSCLSIKELESQLSSFPDKTKDSLTFKYKLLSFYSVRNIDRAFEYFYENLQNENLAKDNFPNFSVFMTNLFQLDKVAYLGKVYETLNQKGINFTSLIGLDSKFENIFSTFLNHHIGMRQGDNEMGYADQIVAMQYLLAYLQMEKAEKPEKLEKVPIILGNKSSEKVEKSNLAKLKLNLNFSSAFDRLAENKFKRREIKSSQDEMLSLFKLYSRNEEETLKFSNESIAKVITLLFDNTSPFDEANFNLLELILDINRKKANEGFVSMMKEHLVAYQQYFGFPPRVLSSSTLKNVYFKHRSQLMAAKQNKPLNVFSEAELDFFVNLFRFNQMDEYAADVLSNWGKFSGVEESTSTTYTECLAVFLLNSNVKQNTLYHKKIDEIFSNTKQKAFVDSLVYKTLAYLKDGNKDFAVDNFFNELEKHMKVIKENDQDLINLYNKAFNADTSNVESQTVQSPDAEFEFTLRKVNLIEEIKRDIRSLFITVKSDSSNKLQTEERVLNMLRNSTRKQKEMMNSYTLSLVQKVNANVKSLNDLTIESVSEELKSKPQKTSQKTIDEKLDEIYSKIKVEMFLNSGRINFLAEVLSVLIENAYDLMRLEFDSEEKKQLLNKLKRSINDGPKDEYSTFLSLVKDYIELKPVSYTKTLLLNENTIRSTVDDELFSKKKDEKVKSYIQSAQNYFKRLRESYNLNDTNNSENVEKRKLSDALAYLTSANLDLNKIVLDDSTISNKEKINILENVLITYRELAKQFTLGNSLYTLGRKNISSNTTLALPLNCLTRHPSLSHNYSSNKRDQAQMSSKLVNVIERFYFYNLITKNKLNDTRKRNLIKALYSITNSKKGYNNMNGKNLSLIACSRNNSVLFKNSQEGVLVSALESLKRLEETINSEDKQEDTTYIDSVFKQLYKPGTQENNSEEGEEGEKVTVGKSSPTTKQSGKLFFAGAVSPQSTQESTKNKINSMKDLLGQEYQHFTVQHAITMIIFGVEHNLPEAVRLAEKVCSDFGYVLPSWVEAKVNKYLIKFSNDYGNVAERIGPVNAASIYRPNLDSDSLFDDWGVKSAYDGYKAPSIWAVDHMPFKGLEEVVDLKKFTLVLRNLNAKTSFLSHSSNKLI